jgi:hypothetical protein
MQSQPLHQSGQGPGLDGPIGVDDDIVVGIVDLEVMWLLVDGLELRKERFPEFILAEHLGEFLFIDRGGSFCKV